MKREVARRMFVSLQCIEEPETIDNEVFCGYYTLCLDGETIDSSIATCDDMAIRWFNQCLERITEYF